LTYLQSCTVLPDLVLLDLDMPIMDGWTFQQAQRSDPRLAQLPVVILSAENDLHRLSALRVDGYLRKPFAVTDLVRLVASILQRQRA
jgi:CheY-like chemotaxis protein